MSRRSATTRDDKGLYSSKTSLGSAYRLRERPPRFSDVDRRDSSGGEDGGGGGGRSSSLPPREEGELSEKDGEDDWRRTAPPPRSRLIRIRTPRSRLAFLRSSFSWCSVSGVDWKRLAGDSVKYVIALKIVLYAAIWACSSAIDSTSDVAGGRGMFIATVTREDWFGPLWLLLEGGGGTEKLAASSSLTFWLSVVKEGETEDGTENMSRLYSSIDVVSRRDVSARSKLADASLAGWVKVLRVIDFLRMSVQVDETSSVRAPERFRRPRRCAVVALLMLEKGLRYGEGGGRGVGV